MDKILKLLEAMQRGMIRLNIGADGPIVWGRTRFGTECGMIRKIQRKLHRVLTTA